MNTPMLKESTDRFLAQFKNGSTDFSNFSLIFSRFLQSSPDPPLEFIWFHSAASFHTPRVSVWQSSERLQRIKDLLQTLVSASGFCNVSKKIAVLAPVVLELHWLSIRDTDSGLRGKVENLIDGVVGYVSICVRSGGKEEEGGDVGLSCCFSDLVGVWMVDKFGGECGVWDSAAPARMFFPVCGHEIVAGVGEGCSVGCLAGVVMCEVMLLGMCLKLGAGSSSEELERSLLDWAVQVITGFRSFYFLDTLLGMLMETDSPVTSVLPKQKDQVLLHKVLIGAIMAVQYSFFNPNSEVHLPWNQLQSLATTFLFVVDNAIITARKTGDHHKALQYSNAFLESGLPSLLIKGVTNQTGISRNLETPSDSTPFALIKWLLEVDGQGINVFDHSSKLYAKALICKSREGYKFLSTMPESKDVHNNIFVHSDRNGRGNNISAADVEMADPVGNDLVSSSRTNLESDGGRKRREGRPGIGDRQVKYTKCLFHEEYEFLISPVADRNLVPNS